MHRPDLVDSPSDRKQAEVEGLPVLALAHAVVSTKPPFLSSALAF